MEVTIQPQADILAGLTAKGRSASATKPANGSGATPAMDPRRAYSTTQVQGAEEWQWRRCGSTTCS